ncbi:MAG: hypothetical protein JW915_12215 [Chitinispirillaceae bacterium]|nr:hypothetical protein [Chitinispirillaceae bacterium]
MNVRFASSLVVSAAFAATVFAQGWTDGGTKVYLTTTGDKVGIGTTSPNSTSKLHVEGTIRVDQRIMADDAGGLELATDEGTVRLKINDNGNVGVGTTSPTQKLQVSGGGLMADSAIIQNATSPVVNIRKTATASTYTKITDNQIRVNVTGMGGGASSTITPGNATFNGNGPNTVISGSTISCKTGPNATATTVITPASVKSPKFEVGTNGWSITAPDYVFASDYNLMPLSQVEKFVSENKHLPGVPSAKEMEEKGHVDLVEMNLTLLKKVEELTLHAITLEKRVVELETTN